MNLTDFVIPAVGDLPPLTTAECLEREAMLVNHIRFQIGAFGSTLVDVHTLRQIAGGTGEYAGIGHRDCAFQIAEQFAWKIELLPAPDLADGDSLLLAPLRFFDPAPQYGEPHRPYYPVAKWNGVA